MGRGYLGSEPPDRSDAAYRQITLTFTTMCLPLENVGGCVHAGRPEVITLNICYNWPVLRCRYCVFLNVYSGLCCVICSSVACLVWIMSCVFHSLFLSRIWLFLVFPCLSFFYGLRIWFKYMYVCMYVYLKTSGRKWRFSTSVRENISQTVSNTATVSGYY